jgi:hypothetical protein
MAGTLEIDGIEGLVALDSINDGSITSQEYTIGFNILQFLFNNRNNHGRDISDCVDWVTQNGTKVVSKGYHGLGEKALEVISMIPGHNLGIARDYLVPRNDSDPDAVDEITLKGVLIEAISDIAKSVATYRANHLRLRDKARHFLVERMGEYNPKKPRMGDNVRRWLTNSVGYHLDAGDIVQCILGEDSDDLNPHYEIANGMVVGLTGEVSRAEVPVTETRYHISGATPTPKSTKPNRSTKAKSSAAPTPRDPHYRPTPSVLSPEAAARKEAGPERVRQFRAEQSARRSDSADLNTPGAIKVKRNGKPSYGSSTATGEVATDVATQHEDDIIWVQGYQEATQRNRTNNLAWLGAAATVGAICIASILPQSLWDKVGSHYTKKKAMDYLASTRPNAPWALVAGGNVDPVNKLPIMVPRSEITLPNSKGAGWTEYFPISNEETQGLLLAFFHKEYEFTKGRANKLIAYGVRNINDPESIFIINPDIEIPLTCSSTRLDDLLILADRTGIRAHSEAMPLRVYKVGLGDDSNVDLIELTGNLPIDRFNEINTHKFEDGTEIMIGLCNYRGVKPNTLVAYDLKRTGKTGITSRQINISTRCDDVIARCEDSVAILNENYKRTNMSTTHNLGMQLLHIYSPVKGSATYRVEYKSGNLALHRIQFRLEGELNQEYEGSIDKFWDLGVNSPMIMGSTGYQLFQIGGAGANLIGNVGDSEVYNLQSISPNRVVITAKTGINLITLK